MKAQPEKQIGVFLRDPNGKLYQEIKEAVKARKPLLLRKPKRPNRDT